MAFLLPNLVYRRNVSKFKYLEIGTLAHRLRSFRELNGLRQADIAANLGVDEFTVLNWENGKTQPEARHVPKLIAFLKEDYRQLPVTLDEKIRHYREGLGLSQRAFAKRLKVDPTTVMRWETGRSALPRWLIALIED